jgi:hypothetical protein
MPKVNNFMSSNKKREVYLVNPIRNSNTGMPERFFLPLFAEIFRVIHPSVLKIAYGTTQKRPYSSRIFISGTPGDGRQPVLL